MLVVALLVLPGVGYCANWVLVHENSTGYTQVDTESIRFYGQEGDRYVSFWLRIGLTDTSNPYYFVQFMNVRENNLNYLIYDVAMVDRRTGKIVKSYNEKEKGWRQAAPGSPYETVFSKLFGHNKAAREGGSGTGFFITPTLLVTNYHVIEAGTKYEILYKAKRYDAEVLAVDSKNDLAILQVNGVGGSVKPLAIANSRDVKEGSKVYTIGYPMPEQLGIRAKLSEGIVNAVSGYKDDMRVFQISIPVQPGNSGGPLLNNKGEVIGVITSGLGFKFLYSTGVLPQNVNYALKSSTIISLASNYQFELLRSDSSQELSAVGIMDVCRDAVVYVEVK